MSWQQTLAQTLVGMGYDLVDLERSAGGLLRVTIDLPWQPEDAQERFVTIEDCERVTRQLQLLLEVEGVEYKRLEVGSPGLDRPLRNETDFLRFTGQQVDITLRQPLGAAAGAGVAGGRKKFRGVLQRNDSGGWQIEWSNAPERKPGQKIGRKAAPVPVNVLGFTLEELREARLAPVVNFKGRATGQAGALKPETTTE